MLELVAVVAVVLMVEKEILILVHQVRQVVHILVVQVYILVFKHPHLEQ